MTDQTPDPIDVIANIPLVWGGDTPTRMMLDRHDAEVVVNALTAAGFQVVPIVDDETREDVLDAVRHAQGFDRRG